MKPEDALDFQLLNAAVRLPGVERPLFSISSLHIPHGARLLLIGPSGSGKTTFLHLLAGLLRADSGRVCLGERDLGAIGDARRAELRRRYFGIIFQKPFLIDFLTARENVLLALPAKKARPGEAADEALERVNLAAKAHRSVSYMSLGEQQRVAVACTLAARPPIILADEPTSSLDGPNAEAILDALFTAAEGGTLVMVSHDERVCRRFEQAIPFEEMAHS